MDWSKAKNILIIAFIVTNIFLAYVLFTTKEDKSQIIIKDELITDVVALLEKENIKVNTDVPKLIPTLPAISVEYEIYKRKNLVPLFLGDYNDKSLEQDDIYINGQKTLEFKENDKEIIYEDKGLKDEKNNSEISKKKALEKSKQFIVDHSFELKDAELSNHSEKDNIHKLIYNKVVDGVMVEETNMTLEISSHGVISFERYWIHNVKKGNENLIISSAPKALLRLLTREEYYGKTINKIDICYYFNVDEYKKSISFNDSTGGAASPTWRFTFADGEKAFLEEN